MTASIRAGAAGSSALGFGRWSGKGRWRFSEGGVCFTSDPLTIPWRGRLTTKASRGAAASHRLSVPARGRGRPSAEHGKGRLSNGDNKMGRYDGGNLRFQRPL